MVNKEELIEKIYSSLRESYPDCKETIKENIELFEKGETPQNIIWMWMEEDVNKFVLRGDGGRDNGE